MDGKVMGNNVKIYNSSDHCGEDNTETIVNGDNKTITRVFIKIILTTTKETP